MHLLHDAPLPPQSIAEIHQRFPGVELTAISSQPAREILATADVIYTENAKFDPADAPRLRWVQTNSASVAHLRETAVMQRDIPFCNSGGSLSTAVAECAIGSLLALTRHIRRAAMCQREHRWPSEMDSWAGVELYGLTMGIVGYGSVGRQIARLAQAFGMTILACKRRPEQHADDTFLLPGTGDPEGTIPAAYFGIDRLHEMLAKSDVVIITLPGTPHTRRLIGVNELDVLPRGAWLVNVGRGAVIDENALIQTLRDGKIAGAALDVFTQEPLPAESHLWDLENVLITPHIASWTTNYHRHCAGALIENLRRNSLGLPLINVIDKQLLY